MEKETEVGIHRIIMATWFLVIVCYLSSLVSRLNKIIELLEAVK